MEYKIKKFSKDQLPNLKELFLNVYHKNSPAFDDLENRFNTDYSGKSFIGYIAYPDKKIISNNIEVPASYYGVFPQKANFNNQIVLCAQSGDTMTHKNHRGQGLFTKLASLTNQLARESGINFIFGFPSTQSYPGFQKKLGWKFPFNMIEFNRFIPTFPNGLVRRLLKLRLGTIKNYPFIRKNLGLETPDSKSNFLQLESLRIPSIERSIEYLEYKLQKSSNKFFIKSNNTVALIKYDGNINIGGIYGACSTSEVQAIMKKISLLGIISGSNRIRMIFSPGSKYESLLKPYGSFRESVPFGYLNFNNSFKPEDLSLSYLDFDYF